MTELGYPDQAYLLQNQEAIASQDKLKAFVGKELTVTDEEIQKEYNTRLESAKAAYTKNLSQYATDVANGSVLYYHPAGYRYVKKPAGQVCRRGQQGPSVIWKARSPKRRMIWIPTPP